MYFGSSLSPRPSNQIAEFSRGFTMMQRKFDRNSGNRMERFDQKNIYRERLMLEDKIFESSNNEMHKQYD